MADWYKLGRLDALMLGTMIGQMSNDGNRVVRAQMALFCWSQMHANAKPCPCFRVGVRTMAKQCGTTPRVAQRFIERAEETGWIVSLGTVKTSGGRYVKRTFAWVADEAADNAGMRIDEWVKSVGGVTTTGYMGVTTSGYTPGCFPSKSGYMGVTSTLEKSQVNEGVTDTYQSTEYSEGVSRLTADAETRPTADSFEAWLAANSDYYDEFGCSEPKPPTSGG